MPTAARRWLLGASIVAGLVVAAAYLRGFRPARAERATRSQADADFRGVVPQGDVTAGGARPAPNSDAERAWRLEVEIRDENDVPINGRVYLTDSKGDLLDALDTEPSACLVQSARGTVSLIAYVLDYVPQFFESLTPPASGVRTVVARVERGAGISGEVVDDKGERVQAWGMRVRAVPLDPPPWLIRKSESWRTQTDDAGRWFAFRSQTENDGTFRIEGLPQGRYEIECDGPRIRPDGAPALLPPERVVSAVGDREVRIVCRRAVEVRVRFVDANTGDEPPTDALATWEATHGDGTWQSGSGGWASGVTFEVAPAASLTLSAEIEGYISPEPMLIKANDKPGIQDVPMVFRLDPRGMAELELVVRDDAGAPVALLMVGHGAHWQRCCAEDGRFLLRIPAGSQRIGFVSPRDEILRLKREWMISADERTKFQPINVYVRQDIDVDLPRGGHVTREVTMQRAALIWVRREPETGIEARLLRGETYLKDAFEVLCQSMGLVAAVEPGTYVVEGRGGEKIVKVEVAAKAGEVAEVWLRVGDAK